MIDPITGLPLDPMSQGLDPMGQGGVSAALASPEAAMVSQAINNIYALRRGQVPGQTPVNAFQQAQNRNEALMLRKAQILDARQRLQEQNRIRAEEAARRANPFWEFEQAKEKGYIPEDMSYEDWRLIGLKGATSPAMLQEMAWLQTATPEEQQAYWQRVRAPTIMAGGGGAQFGVVPGQPGLTEFVPAEAATAREAAQAAAVEGAKTEVEQSMERTEVARQNQQAFETYQAGMGALSSALGGTATGPMEGMLPALTAAAQTAEGAQAIVAPILKTIFRESGEGTFTEGDQKLLMDMLPTRSDLPQTIAFKFNMIDQIVRSKLGISPEIDEILTDDLPDD